MKRREMKGIGKMEVSFGDVDDAPFAPTHRRLGIRTFTHRQAVTDYVGGFDLITGQYFSPHEYRARITLARI